MRCLRSGYHLLGSSRKIVVAYKLLQFNEIPKRKRFRLGWRAFAIVVAVFAGFLTSICIEEKEYGNATWTAAVLLVATLLEFVVADILTDHRYPSRTQNTLDRLERDLRAYHDRIRKVIADAILNFRGCDTKLVSGTFHLVLDQFLSSGDGVEEALVQVTDYSGQLGGQRWRFLSATKGLIGRCLRSGQSEWVNFRSEEDYADRMVREFGFTRAEVEKHTKEARSYWAEPVFAEKKMIGVIFLFSTELQVFPHAVVPDQLRAQAREISAFLEGAKIV